MFLVSPPGLNDWAVKAQKENSSGLSTDIDNGDHKGSKRPLQDDEVDKDSSKNDTNRKRSTNERVGQSSESNTGLSKEYLLNSPIPSRPSKASILKFYDDTSSLVLNDVIEVVGFLSIDASLCFSNLQLDEHENHDEMCAMNPPPSLIPRIHVVTSRKLAHLNPLLYDNEFELDEQQEVNILKDLRMAFTQCLFGDSIAADYLLCHLISTVYVRQNEETHGQFSLNVTNFPNDQYPDYVRRLYEIIELLLPASHYLPVTLDNLNTLDFVPS